MKAGGEGGSREHGDWHLQLTGYEFEATVEIEKDRESWPTSVHGVTKKWT